MRPVLALGLFVSAASLLAAQSGDGPYVIRDGRVFDGETVAERRTVVISEGRIAAMGDPTVEVPAGAQEVAGEGRTLLPGLMDAHIHLPAFSPADALQQTLVFGVTTAVVMWAGQATVSRLDEFEAADRPDAAAVLNAGTGATAPGGHPTQMDGGALARLIPTLTAPGEADAFVAARLAEGSDFIKIIYDDTSDALGRKLPTLAGETVAALVRSAHARGRIAVAHIGSERFARGAIGRWRRRGPDAARRAREPATSAIARAFRLSDRGRINAGMRADLLLVDGDPSKQIRATRNIVAIWKRGVRVQRAS